MRSTELLCSHFECIDLNQSKDRTIHRRHFVSSTQFTFIMIFHPIQIKANARNIFDHDTVWKRLENEFRALFFNRIMHNGIYLNLKPHLYFPFIFSWCCQSSWLTPSNGNTNNKWMRYFLFPPRYVSFASLHLLHVILSENFSPFFGTIFFLLQASSSGLRLFHAFIHMTFTEWTNMQRKNIE